MGLPPGLPTLTQQGQAVVGTKSYVFNSIGNVNAFSYNLTDGILDSHFGLHPPLATDRPRLVEEVARGAPVRSRSTTVRPTTTTRTTTPTSPVERARSSTALPPPVTSPALQGDSGTTIKWETVPTVTGDTVHDDFIDLNQFEAGQIKGKKITISIRERSMQ